MRKKKQRFAENTRNPYVIEMGKPLFTTIRGQWHTYFGNSRPIILELGCGKGAYTLGLAQRFSTYNFVGVDIKGDRISVGSAQAATQQLPNVGFLRTSIIQLTDFFTPQEVAEIYLTFPDPRPKKKDIKRRLTSPRFLRIYQQVLGPAGVIHLKTDNDGLFAYTLEVLQHYNITPLASTPDLYNSPLLDDHYGLQTPYEQKFLAEGSTIKYLRFTLSKVRLEER